MWHAPPSYVSRGYLTHHTPRPRRVNQSSPRRRIVPHRGASLDMWEAKPGVQKRKMKKPLIRAPTLTPSPSSNSCAPYSMGGVPRQAREYVHCYPRSVWWRGRRSRRNMEELMEGIGTVLYRFRSLPVARSLPSRSSGSICPWPWLLLLCAPETEAGRGAIYAEDGWCVGGWGVIAGVASLPRSCQQWEAWWWCCTGRVGVAVVVVLAWIPWAVSCTSFSWLPPSDLGVCVRVVSVYYPPSHDKRGGGVATH